MSMTFYVAKEELKMYEGKVVTMVTCLYPPNFDNTPVVDPEYPEYGAIHPDNPWEINLSNTNAMMILRLLGFENEGEYTGHIGELDKLIQSANHVLATCQSIPEIDGGALTEESRGEKGCLIIECGIREGYIAERVKQLMNLATIAKENEAVLAYS